MYLFSNLRRPSKGLRAGKLQQQIVLYTVNQRALVNHIANKPVNNHILPRSSDLTTFCNVLFIPLCLLFLLFLLCPSEAFLPTLTNFVCKENKIKTCLWMLQHKIPKIQVDFKETLEEMNNTD